MKLYEMFKYDVNIKLKDYIAELVIVLEDREYVVEEDDTITENFHTLRGKAHLIVNRFVKTKWIEKEFLDGSFIEIITPTSYSIRVMRMLSEITDESRDEYNSLVFSTYSALNQAVTENPNQTYEALLSAKSNTETLDYELRTLYHGIRGCLKKIRDNNDVNFLLKNHFEEYKNMADRIYHPVKTMDSIFRYSGPIKSLLSDLRYNDVLMYEMCRKAMTIRNYDYKSEAEEEIYCTIDQIIDMYNSVTILMDQIDVKHSNYTKHSIDKIRYVMSADQSIKGKLVKVLKAYSNSEVYDCEKIGQLLEENISINRQEFIDSNSFYHKNIRSRRSTAPPQPIEIKSDLDKALISDVMSRIKNSYSESRVRDYMDNLFKDGVSEVTSEDISIESDADYILTLLSVVKSSNGSFGYTLNIDKEFISKNGYRIPKFKIIKGAVQNVERKI